VENVVTFSLSDGIIWGIAPGNSLALPIVSRLTETMQLGTCGKITCQILVSVEENSAYWTRIPTANNGTIICSVAPPISSDILALQMTRVATVIALDVQRRGGLLVHGALAERDGYGVILAGPGGIGKTTASQRLPLPWHSLSDDTTLIIRDDDGKYWGHPWPTWSRFMFGKSGGTWDVQHRVPLKGIFFLSQAQEDQAMPEVPARSICLLVEFSGKQVSGMMSYGMNQDEKRELHLNRFDNICALVQAVPCYSLHLSLTGSFWDEIERVTTGK